MHSSNWKLILTVVFNPLINEPPHDKTNNVVVRPAKNQIRACPAQADLSIRWVHNHIVGFVMSWLITSF